MLAASSLAGAVLVAFAVIPERSGYLAEGVPVSVEHGWPASFVYRPLAGADADELRWLYEEGLWDDGGVMNGMSTTALAYDWLVFTTLSAVCLLSARAALAVAHGRRAASTEADGAAGALGISLTGRVHRALLLHRQAPGLLQPAPMHPSVAAGAVRVGTSPGPRLVPVADHRVHDQARRDR
jgi:hypothetical protein